MTLQSQILNWLSIGFEQPTGSLTENFYYDRRNNKFFSVIFADYLMIDENMNLQNNVSNNYTKDQEKSLVDRMKRINKGDPKILAIPRLTIEERQAFMKQFTSKLGDTKLIKTLNQQIRKQDYKTRFDFIFEDETDDLTRENWEEEKGFYLQQKVDSFLNINNINIETATIWYVEDKITISVDLTKDDDKENWTLQ